MTNRTTEQICKEINAVTDKAKHHRQKSKDFRDTRKALVKELRTEYPDTWLAELKERCRIGRTQAFKIAAIADGRADEEKEREKHREAEAKRRARNKSPPRGGLDPKPAAAECGDACDYDWANPPVGDFASPEEMYRKQAEHYRDEAIHLAKAYPLLNSKVPPTELEIQAAQEVVDAWQSVLKKLTTMYPK